ncbi:hypothetical protein [Mycobacterium sp. AZCC_0083]|uniref:hypothetical protein n=1 Tax=Mycobacterium sp. AZCC_0083 TaxID=2735882 RepID=UPI00161C4CE5|nr:hypothetical protein [Mycobacterium sp. AZCC_0083]MBB5167171.1 hypothetical protein [Mycobacterium sp. AZCC_0083]
MSTDIRENYEGLVDGERVVTAYRAFAEPDKPYCITLDLGDQIVSGAFRPLVADEDFTAEEAESLNRANIIDWVSVLTDLIEKAQAWDDFVAEVEEAEQYPDEYYGAEFLSGGGVITDTFDRSGAVDLDAPATTAWSVDNLGYNEIDSVWMDRQGDRYKHVNGVWYIQDCDDILGDWDEIASNSDLLTDYGPYTTTLADRAPRQAKSLGEDERDAEWSFTADDGTVFIYRWNGETWEGKSSAFGDGDVWVSISADGPVIRNTPNYLIEIIK